MSATTPSIADHFLGHVAASPDADALFAWRDDGYAPSTWSTLGRRVARLAAALVGSGPFGSGPFGSGLAAGDRVVQVSANRPEWIDLDLALMSAGLVHVPLHVSLSGEQISALVAHSGARLVVVENREQVDKLVPHAGSLPDDLTLLTWDPWDGLEGHPLGPLPAAEFVAAHAAPDEAIDPARPRRSVGADDLATIMYTSGTTGEPKGVMLSHGNLATNAVASREAYGEGPVERRLCLLPLSHIYARTCDLYTWIVGGSQLALARRRETVIEDCQACRPTLINAVPYFYDKVCRLVTAEGKADEPGAVAALLGGQLRGCLCGGAAAAPHVEAFFEKQGLPLLVGYGLTESSPVITLSNRRAYRPGAVGRPIGGVEVRLDDEGQILTRGPHVMLGYWRDEAATREAIVDGWLRTGDLGRIDDDGFLSIVGRKKELLVLSTGKNVAPTAIEGRLTASPLVAQAMIVGEGRNYLAALIVPDPEGLEAAIRSAGIRLTSRAAALTDPRVEALVRKEIDERLADLSQHEQIGRFALVDRGFSPERGELTPKLSLKRAIIADHFADQIEHLYDET